MDKWNPMKEAYDDRQFNRYNQGVGRDLSGSSYKADKGVRLYVQGIPQSLGQEGLYNLFAEYGKVLDHKLMKSSRENSQDTFGFVTMQSMVDAQAAIEKLDKKRLGQSFLRVNPALTEEEKERRKRYKQQEEEFMSSIGRGRGRRDDNSEFVQSGFSGAPPRKTDSILGQGNRNNNSFQDLGPGLNLDKSDWHTLSQASQESGRVVPKLAISIGRGTFRQVQEAVDTIHLPKEKSLFERMGKGRGDNEVPRGVRGGLGAPGFLQQGRGQAVMQDAYDQHYNMQGAGRGALKTFRPQPNKFTICAPPENARVQDAKLCVSCLKEGCKTYCSRCKAYYCSQDCQKKDWPCHKDICKAVTEFCGDPVDDSPVPVTNLYNLNGSGPNRYPAVRNHPQEAVYDTDVEGGIYSPKKRNQDKRNDRNYDSDCTWNGSVHGQPFKKQDGQKGGSGSDENFQTDGGRGQKTAFNNERQTNKPDTFKKPQGKRQDNSQFKSKREDVKRSPKRKTTLEERMKDDNDSGETPQIQKLNEDSKVQQQTDEESAHTVLSLSLPVKSYGQALLTYYESPDHFWITLQDYLDSFTEVSELMGKELKTKNAVFNPKEGSTYGVFYQGDWCRGTVLSVSGQHATVYFVDYGNTDLVSVEDLRLLTMDMLRLPAQAVCCCVSKLKPKTGNSWSEEAKAAVSTWLGTPMTRFIKFEVVATKGSTYAMKITVENESVGEMLIGKGLAERVATEPGLPSLSGKGTVGAASDQRTMAQALESVMNKLEKNNKLKVILTDMESRDKFAALSVESNSHVQELSSLLQDEYTTDKVPYKPLLGELVAGRFSGDNNWYRAEVVSVDKDFFSLLFIDYGNSEARTAADIRRVKNNRLKEIPALALICKLTETEIPADISENTVNQELQVLLRAVSNDSGQVSMVVKEKMKGQLVVDFVAESGFLLSQALSKKLAELSSFQHCSVSPSKPITSSKASKTPPKPQITSPLKQAQNAPLSSSKVSTGPAADISTETLPKTSEEITEVSVPYVVSCAEFYVRPSKRNANFIAMMKELNASVNTADVLSSPTVGCFAAVQFSADRLWYRGKVIKIDGNMCRVLFIDYGNTETTTDSLRELTTSLCILPAQAIKCRLSGSPELLPTEVHQEFKHYVENETVQVKILGTDNRGHAVQMFAQDGTDIGEALTSYQEEDKSSPRSKAQHRKVRSIALDKNNPVKVECVNMTSPLEFYVQVSDYIPQVVEATLALKTRVDSNPKPVKSVSVGDFVASKYSQDSDVIWYRVRVVKVSGSKCTVFFLDYGNFEETLISELMELSDEDFRLPACTVKCRLNGCSGSTPALQKMFASEGQSQIASIKVISQEGDTCIVDVLDCDGKCVTGKFIKPPVSPVKPESVPSMKQSPVVQTGTVIKTESFPQNVELIPAIITHVDSCAHIYVSRQDEHLQSELLQLMLALNESSESMPLLQGPCEGCLCAAKFSQDGSWYRTQVMKGTGPDTCMVHFIDYGNSEETSVSKLRKIDPALTTLPAQAIRCCLSGHESELEEPKPRCDDKLLHKMRAEILEKPVNVRVVKKMDGAYIVKMEDEHGECISGKFPPPAPAARLTPTLADLIFETPPEKDFDVTFSHIVTLSEFYCQRIDIAELTELAELGQQIKEDVTKAGSDCQCVAVLDGVYASLFQGEWYRCVVKEINGANVLIQYIDYGNCEVKYASELRPLSPERLALPVRTLKCKLYGVMPVHPNWDSPEIRQYVDILRQQQQAHIVIREEDGDGFQVSLSIMGEDVAADLINIKMAELDPQVTDDGARKQSLDDTSPLQVHGEKEGKEEEDGSEGEEEEEENELEIKKKIEELQRQLMTQKAKKKKVGNNK